MSVSPRTVRTNLVLAHGTTTKGEREEGGTQGSERRRGRTAVDGSEEESEQPRTGGVEPKQNG